MTASLIRSRAMITRALDRHTWEEISDGAVLQEDGVTVAVGTYADLKSRHRGVPVVTYLVRRYKIEFQQRDGYLINKITGETWSLADLPIHPLDLCGRLVQDDFCIMVIATERPDTTALRQDALGDLQRMIGSAG